LIDGVVNFVDPDPKVKVSALVSGDAATLEFFVQPFNGTISSFGLVETVDTFLLKATPSHREVRGGESL
jgi:hypothetical protein